MRIDSHHSFTDRYPLDHLASILSRNRFDGSILVVNDFPPPGPVGSVCGIVVDNDLDSPRFLEGYQRHSQFLGVRHSFAADTAASIERRGLQDCFGELESRGIPLDAADGLALIPLIAKRFPDLRIVIDHLGGVPGEFWEREIEWASEFPQVYCKLSGLTRLKPSPRPYVQRALAVFGPKRLMFGSDWPACLPEATWKASLAAFTQAIGAQPIEVREELLGGTAERFYGLGR